MRWLSSFPIGVELLVSLLNVFLSLGLWLGYRKTVVDESGVVATLPARIPITRSVGEEVSLSKFKPTPAVKQPVVVVRPVSQFG